MRLLWQGLRELAKSVMLSFRDYTMCLCMEGAAEPGPAAHLLPVPYDANSNQHRVPIQFGQALGHT